MVQRDEWPWHGVCSFDQANSKYIATEIMKILGAERAPLGI